ncbi:cupin domain-containing protein [Acidithiobacillus sp. VAN18-1]|uniref:Cupin domain-containing protein n=1 Tax=Igneacidithiobacillus copahuensis TaxID=2724909 RepID=A0AAE2YPB3_9PROT|nr:cupin domain-containing protein [Igneacidithiobacillus copahuensis]MBU2795505.1 cupin domain-containing protein [Acidithiobacillus sp. VAN18-2]
MTHRSYLLTAADIANLPGTHKVHFLNPNAERINKSLGDAVGLQNIGVHIITVAPGKDSTEYHQHWYEEECVYVLSGHGSVTIGDEQFPIGPGDFMGFPRNTVAHALHNDGSETLTCLVMGQRLEQDVGDYPRQRKRLYRNSGQWDLVDMKDIADPRLPPPD